MSSQMEEGLKYVNADYTNAPTRMWFGPWYRKSPYFEATLRYGCKAYDIYNRMYLPAEYDDMETEYWALINDVTVWDVGVERQVEITGPDAFKFMNYITPRDMTKCAVGQCKYVIHTTEEGGIINDPVLLRLGENHFWLSLSSSDVLLWAKGVAVNSGMDVTIGEPDVSPMQVQGPKSRFVMENLFGGDVLKMEYYELMETSLDDIPVVITRTGWSAELGYEIYLRDGSRGDELWERVMEAGKSHNIRPIAPSAIRRVEAGILNWGSDMTLDNNPYEVGLGWLVDLDQEADFVGKEALKKIKAEGVKQKLVGVEYLTDKMEGYLAEFWPVADPDGNIIGHASTAVYSPRLEKNIGYVTVPTEFSKLGTSLIVKSPWDDLDAVVVRKPFIDPKKDTPKS
jgi:glycine cleavage system aminomethyltransferase T